MALAGLAMAVVVLTGGFTAVTTASSEDVSDQRPIDGDNGWAVYPTPDGPFPTAPLLLGPRGIVGRPYHYQPLDGAQAALRSYRV